MAYTTLDALYSPVLAKPTALVPFALFGPECSAAFSFSRPPCPCDPRPHCTEAFGVCITHGHMTPLLVSIRLVQLLPLADPTALSGLAVCQRTASTAPAVHQSSASDDLGFNDTRFLLAFGL